MRRSQGGLRAVTVSVGSCSWCWEAKEEGEVTAWEEMAPAVFGAAAGCPGFRDGVSIGRKDTDGDEEEKEEGQSLSSSPSHRPVSARLVSSPCE